MFNTSKKETIGQLLRLGEVKTVDGLLLAENEFIHSTVDRQLIFGLELEIEYSNIKWLFEPKDLTPWFSWAEDGSLRNNGREFISFPARYYTIAGPLRDFYKQAQLQPKCISERCSVHIHTNVSDLTVEQLASLCLLYQIFEKVLFDWIGDGRSQNIFCVPWSETTLNYNIIPRLVKGPTELKQWQKYTALNLLPMFTLGSIEWRHMSGQFNETKILQWMRLISRLFMWVRNNSFDVTNEVFIDLNTYSHYRDVVEQVFQEEAVLLNSPQLIPLLEEGVMTFKYSLMTAPIVTRVQKESNNTYEAGMFAQPGGRRQLRLDRVERPTRTREAAEERVADLLPLINDLIADLRSAEMAAGARTPETTDRIIT